MTEPDDPHQHLLDFGSAVGPNYPALLFIGLLLGLYVPKKPYMSNIFNPINRCKYFLD